MAAALPGMLDFPALKEGFAKLVNQAEPNCLPAFILWLDLKVAQFKINGCMYADTLHEETWIAYAKEVLNKINNRGSHNAPFSISSFPYPPVMDSHNVPLPSGTHIMKPDKYTSPPVAQANYYNGNHSDSNNCVPLSLVKKKAPGKDITSTNSGTLISDCSTGSNSLISDSPGSQSLISSSSFKGSRYQANGNINGHGTSSSASVAPLPNGIESRAHKEPVVIPSRSHTNSTSSAASSYASTTDSLVNDAPIKQGDDLVSKSAPTGTGKKRGAKHTTLRSLLAEPPKNNNDIEAYKMTSGEPVASKMQETEGSVYPLPLPAPVEEAMNGADTSAGESPSHNAYDIQKPNTKEALKIVLTKKSRQRKNKEKASIKTEEQESIPSSGLDLSYSTWNPPHSDVENSPSKSSTAKERVGSPKGHNVCPICYRKFDYRSSFRRHMRIHEGVYSHQCAVCGRKFTRKEHFDRHKCSRRPNKPSRSADGNESSPEKRIKVAYPPTASMEGVSNGGHSTDDHDNSFDNDHSEAMLDDSMYFEKDDQATAIPEKALKPTEDVDSMDEGRSLAGESRRKSSKPRKAVCQPQEEEDVEAFYRNNTPKSSPNEDISDIDSQASPLPPLEHEDKPMDLSEPAHIASPLPSNVSDVVKPEVPDRLKEYLAMSPAYSVSEDESSNYSDPGTPTSMDEFTLDTGSYKVSEEDMLKLDGCDSIETNSHGKFIKVTKQGKYLKLKNEVQVIDGHLCFVCPNCGKVFHRSSNFSRHMRIHRGVYSYLCPTCHRGFFRKEHFQKHKCHRKSMSHIWERKTKLDMVLKPKNADLDSAPVKVPPPERDGSLEKDEENEEGSDRLFIDENPISNRGPTPTEA